MRYLILVLTLLACPVMASEPTTDTPLYNEPIVAEGNIYECQPKHYNPPCRLIGTRPSVSDEDAMNELLAAIRASSTRVETPILDPSDTGPIELCHPTTRGASGCCRVVATVGDKVYVECGK